MFGADRALWVLPARVICLTLTLESKSQSAAPVAFALLIRVKNGSKKKKKSDSKGVLFSLGFLGHIDVRFFYLVLR